MLSAVLSAVVLAAVAVGLVEVIKNFLPSSINTIVKTIISVVVEVVIAVLGVLIFPEATLPANIAVVVGAVGLAQVFYSTILAWITKLKDFLKSKTE